MSRWNAGAYGAEKFARIMARRTIDGEHDPWISEGVSGDFRSAAALSARRSEKPKIHRTASGMMNDYGDDIRGP